MVTCRPKHNHVPARDIADLQRLSELGVGSLQLAPQLADLLNTRTEQLRFALLELLLTLLQLLTKFVHLHAHIRQLGLRLFAL